MRPSACILELPYWLLVTICSVASSDSCRHLIHVPCDQAESQQSLDTHMVAYAAVSGLTCYAFASVPMRYLSITRST